MILMILPHIYSLLKLGYDLLFNKMIKKDNCPILLSPHWLVMMLTFTLICHCYHSDYATLILDRKLL